MESGPTQLGALRFEVLPFESAESAALRVARLLTLTVTCSPRHGNDHTIDVARRLRGRGHTVIVHLAARMVGGPEHLDSLLLSMHEVGLDHVFLVGGDVPEPLGPYESALELLHLLRSHPNAPSTVGVAAYPEGHPLIDDPTLLDTLSRKNTAADYMVTQLCFDPDAVLHWLARVREAGVSLPVYVGIPGIVDRRRLLELSLRVGVGASVSFIRKQRAVRLLARPGLGPAGELLGAIGPQVGVESGVAGLHFFTFNRLVETVQFVEQRAAEPAIQLRSPADRGSASIT
ncbi:MAG TPA: methylenetetrahydrofolate reductase [Solirubrobacteraceae bacterium]|nr:methylenetetrahydrofolate reductase [Solirubrobacteraceae bacterium]